MSESQIPSAFPSEQHETLDGSWNQTFDPGMSLRDWFAGQALPGVLMQSAQLIATGMFESKTGADLNEADFAEQAYAFADAMLSTRSGATS
jgi:hypothetical protein